MAYFSKYVFWHISLSCPISVSEKANFSFWALICFAVFFKHHARLPRLLASCVWLYLQNEAALLFSPLSSSIHADTSSAQAGYLPPPHKSRLYFTSSLAGLINKKIYPCVCLPSCAPLSLTAAVSVRTFLLRFKAPRRLMSYPPIMKGETLLGFETAAKRASSSLLSLFPLSSSRVQRASQHFHLGGIRSVTEPALFLLSFLITCRKIPGCSFLDPLKRHPGTAALLLCWDVFQMRSRGDYCCSISSSWSFSSACVLEQSIKALSHL